MQRILSLSEKDFLTGISPSAHVQDQGLWSHMRDVTVVRDLFIGNDETGLLQGASEPSEFAELDDVPIAYARNITGSTDQVYYFGDAGHLYEHDISGATVTDKRDDTPITDAANGLAIFQPRDGTKYLYYWQKTQIGRWDLSGTHPTGWEDDWATGLNDTTWHPTHRLFDREYYGNGNQIGYIGDDGAAAEVHVPDALDLDVGARVNCLSDDGVYLVAGISNNTSTVINNISTSKVIFWDGNQSSWQREWDIPDSVILSIKRRGAVMEVVCSAGIYAFTFSEPPQLVLGPLDNQRVPDYDYPSQGAAAVLADALLFASQQEDAGTGTLGDISSFGKLAPQGPNAYLRPFGGLPTKPVLIMPDIEGSSIYVSCRARNFLYSISRLASGSTLTGPDTFARTIYIDLKRWWQIGRVVLFFESQLDEDDQVAVYLQPDPITEKTVGSVTGGGSRNKEFYTSVEAHEVMIKIAFLGGVPELRGIELWGDPLATPSHSRI
jgi:hypothetical protein